MRIKQLLVIAVGTIAVASLAFAQGYTPTYTQPGANIIFQDNFSNGSTMNNNSGMPPQANNGAHYYNATSYDWNSSKGASLSGPSLIAGDMTVGLQASSSSFVELQAPINSRPAIAATSLVGVPVGSFIDVLFEFTDTLNLISNSSAPGTDSAVNQLNIGLFDSMGSGYPNPSNLATISTATGGSQDYQGYYSDIVQANNGTSSKVFYRAIQNTGTGDMTLTVASGINGAFQRPTGGNLINGSQVSTLVLTNGQYTEDFRITLMSGGNISVSNELFAGVGTTGTCEFAFGGYTNAADPEFDTLAFGFANKESFNMTQDVNFISVTTDFVPEPSTWLMLISGLSVVAALVSRRRR